MDPIDFSQYWFFTFITNPSMWLILTSAITTGLYGAKVNEEKFKHCDHLIYLISHFSAFFVATVLFVFNQSQKYFVEHMPAVRKLKEHSDFSFFEIMVQVELWLSAIVFFASIFVLAQHLTKFNKVSTAYDNIDNTKIMSIPKHWISWSRVTLLVSMWLISLLISEVLSYKILISN